MIDKETADVIAMALFNQDIIDLDVEALDELAVLRFFDDDDVEFTDVDFTLDAGPGGHGINNEDEMLQTVRFG
jgi:hypothetical protein